ncbi:hypothetical protein ACE7GA_08870 [Roseomonas sp. CCTCC AB2023176]|uniref:hypothetical protein n=1 Tax=Roseomonas sp. CCTCC AB2023176 TaxID=3342640 RepID=UPI0035DB7BB3
MAAREGDGLVHDGGIATLSRVRSATKDRTSRSRVPGDAPASRGFAAYSSGIQSSAGSRATFCSSGFSAQKQATLPGGRTPTICDSTIPAV